MQIVDKVESAMVLMESSISTKLDKIGERLDRLEAISAGSTSILTSDVVRVDLLISQVT